MFRNFFIIAMFITAAGYCFAESLPQQSVTSQVYYDTENINNEYQNEQREPEMQQVQQVQQVRQEPVWPMAGSDADMTVACDSSSGACKKSDNIKIVSKIGADLVVENNFNMGGNGISGGFDGWSGGANVLHGANAGGQVPAGFEKCDDSAQMPLLGREMLEDDGGSVLAMSKSGRKTCGSNSSGVVFNKNGSVVAKKTGNAGSSNFAKTGNAGSSNSVINNFSFNTNVQPSASSDRLSESISGGSDFIGTLSSDGTVSSETIEFDVDQSADAESPKEIKDQVRSWVVASGQSLREVLQNWCDKEGWDLVWATAREYPIEASAVFKGRFVDVSSALVRNFGRATPVPYAKFYKGNRVLVISTTEE